MSEKKEQEYNECFRRIKEAFKKHSHILESEFPDDVTVSGSPELLKKNDDEIDSDKDEN